MPALGHDRSTTNGWSQVMTCMIGAAMRLASLPQPIALFLHAMEEHDSSGLLATFTPDAILIDGNREHCGGDAIEEWNDHQFLGANVTAYPINLARRDGKIVLTVMARGNREGIDGARSVQLDWWFAISGDKIAALTITRDKAPNLPAPVAAYVQAVNTFNLDAFLATFADDALVNDQLCDYWGKPAIREWAARDIIGGRLTMYVVGVVEHYGHVIVTAHVDGDYDPRGLPDPLVLSFYFSAYGDKIVQLIILRNQRDS
jgi:ketosteroid isomerase-like protein